MNGAGQEEEDEDEEEEEEEKVEEEEEKETEEKNEPKHEAEPFDLSGDHQVTYQGNHLTYGGILIICFAQPCSNLTLKNARGLSLMIVESRYFKPCVFVSTCNFATRNPQWH